MDFSVENASPQEAEWEAYVSQHPQAWTRAHALTKGTQQSPGILQYSLREMELFRSVLDCCLVPKRNAAIVCPPCCLANAGLFLTTACQFSLNREHQNNCMNCGQCPSSTWQTSLHYGTLPTVGVGDQSSSYLLISGGSRVKF